MNKPAIIEAQEVVRFSEGDFGAAMQRANSQGTIEKHGDQAVHKAFSDAEELNKKILVNF